MAKYAKPIIITEFEDADFKRFVEEFELYENSSDISMIPIMINSYGGSVHNVLAMRDIIKSSNKMVSTFAVGKAMSAGCFLLASGKKGLRFASPSCDIMFHQLSTATFGKLSDMVNDIKASENLQKILNKNFSEDIGRNEKFVLDLIEKNKNSDIFMTPQEALRIGIIDVVGTPRSWIVEQEHAQIVLATPDQMVNVNKVGKPVKKGKK